MKLTWRYGRDTGYYYYGDGVYDHGHVVKLRNDKWAATASDFTIHKTLQAAKHQVEREVRRTAR